MGQSRDGFRSGTGGLGLRLSRVVDERETEKVGTLVRRVESGDWTEGLETEIEGPTLNLTST